MEPIKYSDLFGILTVKCHLPPAYVLDEMTPAEMESIIEAYQDSIKTPWEQTRMIMYAIISSQSTKRIRPVDVMRFPWEKEQEKEAVPSTKERFQQLKELWQ